MLISSISDSICPCTPLERVSSTAASVVSLPRAAAVLLESTPIVVPRSSVALAAASSPAPSVAPLAIPLVAAERSNSASLTKVCCSSARPSILLVATWATTVERSNAVSPSNSSKESTTVLTVVLSVAVTSAALKLVCPNPFTAFLVAD